MAKTQAREFAPVWNGFVEAIGLLIEIRHPNYRGHFNPFGPWAKRVLASLADDNFVGTLDREWSRLHSEASTELAASLLLDEMRAFNEFVSLQSPPVRDPLTFPRRPSVSQAGLDVGATILDSFTKLLDQLPFGIKAILEAAKELAKIAGTLRNKT